MAQKEKKLIEKIVSRYHIYTNAENEYRRHPSQKTFDDYQKSEAKFMLAIQIAEEYLEKCNDDK